MNRSFFVAAIVAATSIFVSTPSSQAEELGKEDSCRYQGLVMAAVQQARLDRVKQDEVEATILASAPEWPEQFSNAIAQLVPHVYAMKRKDLRQNELGPILEAQCLSSWDQIQAMKDGLSAGN